jgi:hypothetical protein
MKSRASLLILSASVIVASGCGERLPDSLATSSADAAVASPLDASTVPRVDAGGAPVPDAALSPVADAAVPVQDAGAPKDSAGPPVVDAGPPRMACDGGYTIAPAALSGCRSPLEPGCARCCVPSSAGCSVFAALGPWDAGDVTPWYNDIYSNPECPEGCLPCAACLDRSEELLCELLDAGQGCDCTQPPGLDPCGGGGCDCYCSLYMGVTQACPRAP